METNAFEKIAKLTKSIFDFEAKRKEFNKIITLQSEAKKPRIKVRS